MRIEIEGTVEEIIPRGLFKVRTDAGQMVRATLSTEAKRVMVKVLPRDRVILEMSGFDPNRGRIKSKI